MATRGGYGRSRASTALVTNEPEVSNSTLLERIHNFLGDEDIHRNYDFLPHMNRIDEYLDQLFLDYIGPRATKKLDFEIGDWEQARLMVKTHKDWIAKDREVRPVDFSVVKALLEERSHILSSDSVRPASGMTIIPAPVHPTNIAIPQEARLTLALPPNDVARKKLIDPLEYTKKAAQYRRLKEYAATHTEDETITSHIPAPPNFHGPITKPLTEEEIDEATTARLERLNNLKSNLKAAERAASRLLLRKVLQRIEEGAKVRNFDSTLLINDLINDFHQWTTSAEAVSPLTETESKLLTVLTEPSWASTIIAKKDGARRAPAQVLDQHPEDRFTPSEIPNLGTFRQVRYNGDGEMGPQITLDKWAVFQRLGYRLGVETARLTLVGQSPDQEVFAPEAVQEAKLKDLIENQFPDLSLDEIIMPLVPPGQITDKWTPAQKTSILREKILQESLAADNDRKLNYSKLWSFASTRTTPTAITDDDDDTPILPTYPKTFFSVSRWPLEIQTPQTRQSMQAKAPIRDRKEPDIKLTPEELAAIERASIQAYFKPMPRERFIRGVPFYPFGETRVQERILSAVVSADLEGVDGYDFRPARDNSNLGFFGRLNPRNWFGGSGRKRKASTSAAGDGGAGKRHRQGWEVEGASD